LSVRLNKLLAQRGLGARRKCDALVQSGAVRINGEVVREPGTMVEPGRDRIEVRNRPLPPATATRYFVLHKPVGVISTLSDPEGRRTIRDLLPPGPRLFPVGRLDADTSGLLVLTNDGELAHRLMHPRYGVAKSYRVRVAQVPQPAQIQRLATGVEFEPGIVSAPARAWIVDASPERAMLSLVIHEGRYRQVRRMCEAVGLTVLGLHRSAYGPLRLGELTRGMWRELSEAEVASLRAASARPSPRPRPEGRYLGVPRGERAARRAPAVPRASARMRRSASPGRPGGVNASRARRRPESQSGPERPAGRRRRGAEFPARRERTSGGRRRGGEFPARRERTSGRRRRGTERPGRSGEMARRDGRGGAKFRSRKPPRRPGGRRSR
jgi:23S rRNA pseudouridine2605 synthase